MVNTKQQDGAHLYLHIVEEPLQIFYKDEGGKANTLKCSGVLSFSPSKPDSKLFEPDYSHSNNSDTMDEDESAKAIPIGNLKISPKLVYENGDPVEDACDIFKVIKVEPQTVTSTNEVFKAWFRIDKVSRRKDGRKFRVRMEVDKYHSTPLSYVSIKKLLPKQSRAINVLSKRKSNLKKTSKLKLEHGRSSIDKDPTKKAKLSEARFRESLEKLNELSLKGNMGRIQKGKERTDSTQAKQYNVVIPADRLTKVMESNQRLEQTVESLLKRVSILESAVLNKFPEHPFLPPERRRVHSLLPTDDGYGSFAVGGADLSRNGMPRNNSSTGELLDFLHNSSFH
eukprot:maker-scaffold_1-snap-gene-17.1-mRNA-1 protein AED:0.09 eAED:0.09 QI:237/1/1/1/0.33/0/4/160/339